MDLTLSVIAYRGERPAEPVEVTFHERSGTIGRKPHNDLVLPDPERVVSSTHVRIEYQGGRYHLLDQSMNGTFLNHAPEPVERGRPIPLSDGDVLTVGDYELRVALQPAESAPGETPSPPVEEVPVAASAPSAGPEIDQTPLDPLALIEPAGAAPRAAASTPSATAPFPDDLDLLAGLQPGPMEAAPPPDRGPPEQAPYVPPPPSEPAAPVAEAQTGPAPPAVGEGGVAPPVGTGTPAVTALLRGLGLGERKLSAAEAEALLETVGQLLRTAVEGLMRVLATRTEFKRQMRLEMTTLRPVENNPLKFSVDASEALERMLFEKRPGFLPPVQAMQEAVDDVLAHEMAVLAGIRAALQALLDRLDPKTLEARFDTHASLAGVLPALRKSRYWNIYVETYNEVRHDAEEGFLRLFGEAFVQAYEKQVRALKSH